MKYNQMTKAAFIEELSNSSFYNKEESEVIFWLMQTEEFKNEEFDIDKIKKFFIPVHNLLVSEVLLREKWEVLHYSSECRFSIMRSPLIE